MSNSKINLLDLRGWCRFRKINVDRINLVKAWNGRLYLVLIVCLLLWLGVALVPPTPLLHVLVLIFSAGILILLFITILFEHIIGIFRSSLLDLKSALGVDDEWLLRNDHRPKDAVEERLLEMAMERIRIERDIKGSMGQSCKYSTSELIDVCVTADNAKRKLGRCIVSLKQIGVSVEEAGHYLALASKSK